MIKYLSRDSQKQAPRSNRWVCSYFNYLIACRKVFLKHKPSIEFFFLPTSWGDDQSCGMVPVFIGLWFILHLQVKGVPVALSLTSQACFSCLSPCESRRQLKTSLESWTVSADEDGWRKHSSSDRWNQQANKQNKNTRFRKKT